MYYNFFNSTIQAASKVNAEDVSGDQTKIDCVNQPSISPDEAAEIPLSQLCQNTSSAATKGKRKAPLRKSCVDNEARSGSQTLSSSVAVGPMLKTIKQEKK